MKTLALFFLLFSFSSAFCQDSPRDFEYRLSDIARSFRNNIMDEDDCARLRNEAGDLAIEIEDAIEEEEEYSSTELQELRGLEKEAEALEDYIGVVGGGGSHLLSIDDLQLANKRVRGAISYLSRGKDCMNVLTINIGDYVCFLGENASASNYTASYAWKVSGSYSKGNGTMGLPARNLRHIYDNREKPQQKAIVVYEVSCKPF